MARKILLADDSVTAQNMGRKILTDAGYDVITVNNGSAALKRVTEQKPDLVVLDVYMPGYSGLEVCARLKDSAETARIPILLTVGKLEPFKPEEATRVKADGFIVKPFEASELLSALTRLEDRMVPPQAEGARFSTSVSGIERFSGDPAVKKSEGGDESDSGWKNRLRFPSKKKKEEPEPEPDFVTPPSFRDYRRGGGKAPASGAFPVSAPAATGQEPGLVPDIPRDITPDELDALSALVAKLDGPIPESENIAPLSEKIGAAETPAPEAKAEAKTAEAVTPPSELKSEADGAAAPAEVKKDAEAVPAAESETQVAASAASAPAAETPQAPVAESTQPEVEAARVEAPVVAAIPAEPAPVDKSDEPRFASPASAAPEVSSEKRPEVEAETASAPSAAAESVKAESAAPAEETKVDAPKVETSPEPAPVAVSARAAAEAEVPAPSAEELAEALRWLTPSQATGQTLAQAGAALAQELSRGAAGGNRWVAEAVALSPEEASVSLEAEMFRTFAAAGGDGNSGASSAVVERKAEERVEASVSVPEAKAEVREHTAPAEESRAASAATAEKADSERRRSRAKRTEEEPEAVGATTFADAVHRQEAEMVASSPQNANAAAPDSAQEEVSRSDDGSGGQEAMGKDAKGKGKSNWHQIRSGAPAAATDAVEAAKQTEESPKAMAAAASADSASDASSIASIVDSVLADLRPKIVEEIAKKLAKK